MGSHNPLPPGSLVSSLTHYPVSGYDTNPSPPVVDIICFDTLFIVISLTIIKCVYEGQIFTPLLSVLRAFRGSVDLDFDNF